MGWRGQAGGTQGTHVVDELLDAVAQFVFVVPVERVVDGREGRVDAVCGGAAHVVDEIGQVFGGLQLDAPVRGGVHGGWLCLGVWLRVFGVGVFGIVEMAVACHIRSLLSSMWSLNASGDRHNLLCIL